MQEKNTIYSIFFKNITICCILACSLGMIRIYGSIQNFYGKKTGAKVIAQNLVDFEQLIAKYKVYVCSIVIPAPYQVRDKLQQESRSSTLI